MKEEFIEFQFLINLGIDPNLCQIPTAGPKTKVPILYDSARRGNQRLFKFLLQIGASTDIECAGGKRIDDYINEDYEE